MYNIPDLYNPMYRGAVAVGHLQINLLYVIYEQIQTAGEAKQYSKGLSHSKQYL
jgi:hypothetical protein